MSSMKFGGTPEEEEEEEPNADKGQLTQKRFKPNQNRNDNITQCVFPLLSSLANEGLVKSLTFG